MSVAERVGRKPGVIDSLKQFTIQARHPVAKHIEVIRENVLDFIDLERTPEAKFYEPGEKVIFNKTQTRELIRNVKNATKSKTST